ncbi:MAG TPA: GntR family transcriptional regulator [Firmicutes bacterium]|nr:GntR family transcriptional regulator [Candidatus Fermentithermobacillaceae bacterium]
MVSTVPFDDFHIEDGSPVYLQIMLFVKRGIVAGSIQNGDELPSRRVLSSLLGVNPNTVQKAYRMLEEEGLIQSHTGAKSYVVLDQAKKYRIRAELMEAHAKATIRAMRQMGISKEEALSVIDRLWES